MSTRHSIANARRLSNLRIDREYTDFREALTGRLLASGVPETNPSQDLPPGYIWIRFTKDSPPARATIGSGMAGYELATDYPVKTGVNTAHEREAIKPSSISPQTRATQAINARNGTIPGYLNSTQFTPGIVHGWGQGGYGLNVYVEEFTYKDRLISGHLPVAVPGTTNQRYQGVVYYDYDNDTLAIAYGTASTAPAVLFNRASAVAISIGAGDRVRLFAVLLEHGQTDVLDTTPFYDLRDWLTPDNTPSGGGGSVTIQDTFLTSDVTIAAGGNNTFYDGPTVTTTGTGVWEIYSQLTIAVGNQNVIWEAKLWDGTTVINSGKVTAIASGYIIIALQGKATSAGTYKLSVNPITDSSGDTILATALGSGGTNKASYISAKKLS